MGELWLRNRRVLVVEDEYLLADAMEHGLRQAGATVLGPVPSVGQALALLNAEPDVDGAVLDINVGDGKVYAVADVLTARGVRFVFTTGYDASEVPPAYQHVACIEKPVNVQAIARALGR